MLYLIKIFFYIEILMVIGLGLFRYALAPRYRSVVSASTVTLALLTPVVALFCGNFYLFCAYLMLAVAFSSRSRAELAGNFAFLLPLMPILAIETGVGSIYLLPVTTVLAMSLGTLIGFVVTSNAKSLAVGRYDAGMLALIGMIMFTASRDASVTSVLRALTVNVIVWVGPYLLVSRAIRNAQDVERLLLRLTLGGFLTALTACFQAIKHWVLFEAYYQALHVPMTSGSVMLALRAGMLRTGGSMVDYSAAGLFLAALLTLTPVLRRHFRPLGFWAVVAVLSAGLIATQSRGAWVAAIVGLLFILAYRGMWGRLIVLGGGAAVALIGIRAFATSGRLAAIFGQAGQSDITASYRQRLAERGLDQIKAHPLFGQTYDQLVANMQDMMQGQHIVDFVNGHLYFAMTAGIPFFLVWCVIWLMPVVESWRGRNRAGNLMEASAAIMVPAMVALTFTSLGERNLTWPTIAFGLAGPCLVLGRRRNRLVHHSSATREPPVQRQPYGTMIAGLPFRQVAGAGAKA